MAACVVIPFHVAVEAVRHCWPASHLAFVVASTVALAIAPAQDFTLLAPARVAVGQRVPAAEWSSWLQGEAPVDAQAAKCTVYAFYTRPPYAPAFASDGAYLAALQGRHQQRGLRIVAVAADQHVSREAWPGCAVVVDADSATTGAWFAEAELPWNLVVVDADGVVVFLGSPEAGLVDAIENTLAGTPQFAAAAAAHAARYELAASFDDLVGSRAIEPLERVLAHAPHDGLSFGLLYLVHATKTTDADAATKVLQQAVDRLAAEARPLAAFADLALRGDPRRPGLAETLAPPLAAAARALPADVVVQLANLRLLVRLGDGREVGRAAIRLRKRAASAAQLMEFATILTQAPDAPVHRDTVTMALDQAAALGVAPRLLAAARYGVAVRCAEDLAGADAMLDAYLQTAAASVEINDDCWYAMTGLVTMGHFDTFAVGLAERMLRERESMQSFEFDTAALAMFRVGRIADAIELQEAAIAKSGGARGGYRERLERYRRALSR